MYEDLVKDLRELSHEFYLDDSDDYTEGKLSEAADAIEQLSNAGSAYGRGWTLGYDAGREESKPRWIPVEERLPEEGVSVQVCFRSQGGKAQAVSERFVDNRNQSYWSGLCGMKPTHWMPLPEPPKEE